MPTYNGTESKVLFLGKSRVPEGQTEGHRKVAG